MRSHIIIKKYWKPSESIWSHMKPCELSVAIENHKQPLDANRNNHNPFGAIKTTVAIWMNREPSKAIRSHQKSPKPLRSHRTIRSHWKPLNPAGAMNPLWARSNRKQLIAIWRHQKPSKPKFRHRFIRSRESTLEAITIYLKPSWASMNHGSFINHIIP